MLQENSKIRMGGKFACWKDADLGTRRSGWITRVR